MADDGEVREGGCRCGRVRFRVRGKPLITMACHCTGCRRMTASAFSLSGLPASGAFEVLEGEPAIGGLHGATAISSAALLELLFTRPEGWTTS